MPKLTAVRELIAGLEALELPYAIAGSFASSLWGQPRFTQDLDISIDISLNQANEFTRAFESAFMISANEMNEAFLFVSNSLEASGHRQWTMTSGDEGGVPRQTNTFNSDSKSKPRPSSQFRPGFHRAT